MDRRPSPGRPPARQAALVELLRAGGPLGVAEIERALGALPSATKGLLQRAIASGLVVREGRGRYAAA